MWKILVKLTISALFIKLQISWPADVDCVGDEVDVDEWWESVDMRIVEQAAISRSVKAPVLKAEKIAPWIPPMCRNTTVVNSETQKGNVQLLYYACQNVLIHYKTIGGQRNPMKRMGSPKKLADLIRNGSYNPETLKTTTVETLREICIAVEIPISANATKVHIVLQL